MEVIRKTQLAGGKAGYRSDPNAIIADPFEHLEVHHGGADGWITLASKSPRWRYYHYKPEELAEALKEWVGVDSYYSLNTFFKPVRSIESVRELRACWADVDSHRLGYPDWYTHDKLELEVWGEALPPPNLVIFSGRGLFPLWLIEPAPVAALPLWYAIQRYICQTLAYVGADPRSIDAARVARIAGSISSKSGKPVEVRFHHDYRYSLRELKEYLPPLEHKAKKVTLRGIDRTRNLARLYNLYTLHWARIQDLLKLVELREYHMTGHREITCFLYRYWVAVFQDDPEAALAATLELNRTFTEPLPEREVVTATRSAERAYRRKVETGRGYEYSNRKLIEVLSITPEEQQHLKTIIGKAEKYRRKNKARTAKRRGEGVRPRAEYEADRKASKQEKLELLRQAMAANPGASGRQLARLTGLSESYVRKLKAEL